MPFPPMYGNFTEGDRNYKKSPNSTLQSNKTEDEKEDCHEGLHIGMFENNHENTQGFTVDGLNFYSQQTSEKVDWPSEDQEPTQPYTSERGDSPTLNYNTSTKEVKPLETIFEDTREYQGDISQQIPLTKRPNKPLPAKMATLKPTLTKDVEADIYLDVINKQLKEKQFESKVKAKLADDLNKAFDISQMS